MLKNCLHPILFLILLTVPPLVGVAAGKADSSNTAVLAQVKAPSARDKGYLQCAAIAYQRVRSESRSSSELSVEFRKMRDLWLTILLEADSTAPQERQVQTVWTTKLAAPPPGIGFASWILLLQKADFGLIGCDRLTAFTVAMMEKRLGVIFCETEEGLLYVDKIVRSRRRIEIILSDGTVLSCGNDRKKDFCQFDGARRWILVLPTHMHVCTFLRHTRANSRSVGAHLFWYPKFIIDYAKSIGGAENPAAKLGILHDSFCSD